MELLKDAYIYCFKLKDQIIYIGKSHQPIVDRLDQHLTQCHNEKLKEYLKSDFPPVFEIIYESHNEITEEILKSIERSYIETLQPECNVLGVTKPYDLFESKDKGKKSLGWADVLAKKKTLSDQDLDVIIHNNPQIKSVLLITIKDEVEKMKEIFQKEDKYTPSDDEITRYIKKAYEAYYGKLNDFNSRKYYNPETGHFQQKAWFVRNKETTKCRCLTNYEKQKGFKNTEEEELVQGRILYRYGDDNYVYSLIDSIIEIIKDKKVKSQFDDELIDLYQEISSIDYYLSREDHLSLYFPFTYAMISDEDGKQSVIYTAPLAEAALDHYMHKKDCD